ncbi:MAG: U32 family peptidase [Coriobacteriales bacterium]|nr:U32 family peptidase [Coriobacteriales bacterium]
MIYSVPVNDASEVPALAAAGAGELYCGLQEPWWVERYGNHDSMSRRQGRANLASRQELAHTVTMARKHRLPLFLALNGQYDERQLDYLEGLANEFQQMGGEGLIVRDLGLLMRLEECGNDLKRVCSLLAVCANVPSVMAFARLGVTRVVFPRFLDANSVGHILRASAREGVCVEAECMVFFDKCPLVDGYCTHYHGVSYPDRVGAVVDLHGEPLYAFDTTYRTHACLGTRCDYLEPYPCAACDVANLERCGVGFGKLGGRGRPLQERVRALEFLRAAQAEPSDEARKRLYEQTFGKPCACYYGATIQDRMAIEPIRLQERPGHTYVGDLRDGAGLCDALRELADVSGACTVLVGPLPQSELEPGRWEQTVELLCEALACRGHATTCLCANDVGALVALAQACGSVRERLGAAWGGELVVVPGPLLTRGDKPAEFGHFLAPEQNPSRPVWDLDGNPRTLTYQSPPSSLVDHWERGMDYAQRTSYQRALACLVAGPDAADGACAV